MRAPSLRIVSSELALLADLDRYSELYYTRSLAEPGDFAFLLPLAADIEGAVAKGNFVLVGNDGTRIGIIEETERRTFEKRTEWIIARGHEAKAIFARRITLPGTGAARIEMDAPAETVMKALVNSQCGPDATEQRRFPGLSVAPDLERGCHYSISTGYSILLLELGHISKASGLGFNLSFDIVNKKLIFDIIDGLDRSAGQQENARALFASEYATLLHASLAKGFGRFASALYVLGPKLPEGRQVTLVWKEDEPEGFERFERALDAPGFDTLERLHAYGIARLGAYPKTFFLEAELPANSPLRADKDFCLGDLCSVHAYGQWYTVPIHSIEERWTKDGSTIRLGFGQPALGAFSASMHAANELMDVLRAS